MEPARRRRATAFRSFVFVGLLAGAGVFSSAGSAYAQVGPLLSVRPWFDRPVWAETWDDLVFFDRGHTKGADESIKNFYWDSAGRVKFWKDRVDPPFSLGYRILTIDTDSDNTFLDGQWNDVSIAAGKQFGTLFDTDWNLGLVAGLGTANDGHWSNDDAIYGLGTLDLWTPVSDEASIHAGIYYDGNRALIQDIPLPFVTYQHRIADELELAVGLPDTMIEYFPAEQWTLSFLYHFPADVRARVDFEVVPDSGVHLFAFYSRAVRQFYIDEDNRSFASGIDNRRLFFEIDRIGVGVRWVTFIDVGLAVGYTLDSRYRAGWDMRDLDTVRDLSEGLYFSFTLQGTVP